MHVKRQAVLMQRRQMDKMIKLRLKSGDETQMLFKIIREERKLESSVFILPSGKGPTCEI
jgi:hypothetical protein